MSGVPGEDEDEAPGWRRRRAGTDGEGPSRRGAAKCECKPEGPNDDHGKVKGRRVEAEYSLLSNVQLKGIHLVNIQEEVVPPRSRRPKYQRPWVSKGSDNSFHGGRGGGGSVSGQGSLAVWVNTRNL